MLDSEEHNLNDLVAMYESGLMDKYFLDQKSFFESKNGHNVLQKSVPIPLV